MVITDPPDQWFFAKGECLRINRLLYSTGISTQYSVMTYMGKESKEDWIYG